MVAEWKERERERERERKLAKREQVCFLVATMNEDTSLAIVAQSFLKSSPLFQKKELQLNEAQARSGPPPIPKKKPQRTKDNGLNPGEGKGDFPVKKNGSFWMKKRGPLVKPYQGTAMKLEFHSLPHSDKKSPSSPVKLPTQPSKGSILYQLTNGHSPSASRRSKLEQIMQNKQQLMVNTEEDNKLKSRPLPQVPKLPLRSNRDSARHTYAYPDFNFSSKKHNSHPPAIQSSAGGSPDFTLSSKKHNSHPPAIQSSAGGRKHMERCNSAGSIRQASSEPQLPKTASSPLEPHITMVKSVSSADLLKGSPPLLQFEAVDDDEYFQMVGRVKPYSVVSFSSPTEDRQQQNQKNKKEEEDDDDDDDNYVEMHPSPSGYTYIDSHPVPESLDDEEGEYQYVDMNRGYYPTSSSTASSKTSAKLPLTTRKPSTQQTFSPTNNIMNKLGSSGDDDDIYY